MENDSIRAIHLDDQPDFRGCFSDKTLPNAMYAGAPLTVVLFMVTKNDKFMQGRIKVALHQIDKRWYELLRPANVQNFLVTQQTRHSYRRCQIRQPGP